MHRNLALKFAMVESGKTQRAIAIQAAMGEVRLSGIVRGKFLPTAEEKRTLARVLRKPQRELFPSVPVASASAEAIS